MISEAAGYLFLVLAATPFIYYLLVIVQHLAVFLAFRGSFILDFGFYSTG